MAFELPKLAIDQSIVEQNGKPSLAFHKWWQLVINKITSIISDLEQQVSDIQAAQAAANAAQTAAATAQTAANTAQIAATTAQNAANTTQAITDLTGSGVLGASITATDVGSDVSISISAHTRTYADGTSVSVNSGNLAGLSYSTTYYIYYNDPSRAGGAVSYQATTTASNAVQTGDKHLVGSVTTPAALGSPSSGKYVLPPGLGSLY